jgi:hypothetical protein
VSLRRDLHAAFDELEPSMFGLSDRVVDAVMVGGRARRRREGIVFRLKAPLSLVAVMMLIALVVGALIGGKLVQDWNATHSTPAGGLTRAQQIADLEARPWQQPLLPSGAVCPDGPKDSAGVYGSGPFHGDPTLGTGPVQTNWGSYFFLVGTTDSAATGLMLIRARDMHTGAPLVFVGQYATGPVVGTDTVRGVAGQQHSELLLDMSHRPTGSAAKGPNGSTYWSFTVGAAKAWPSCAAWQVDVTGYTEAFSFAY